MATNALLTPSLITRQTLDILANNLVAAAKVDRQFENQFYKIGTTLTVRKPNRFIRTLGPGLSVQNITEPATSITITTQSHCDFQFSTTDLTLVIEEFTERYLKPIAETLANGLDYDVLQNWSSVFNQVGTPGTPPASYASLAAVGQAMDKQAVGQDGRVLILGEDAYWSLTNGLTTLFVVSVAEPALKGFLAKIANFEIYMDQNMPVQTVGVYGGTPLVNLAGQTGSTISLKGFTAGSILNAGDVFTIAGVFGVNPQSRQTTSALQKFVVTATTTADGSGNMAALPIYPAITLSPSPYQTVTGSPANNAAITIQGVSGTSYVQNLAFTKQAFGLVVVPMDLPSGTDFAAREMYKNISLRIVRDYQIGADVIPCRTDLLYGSATFYPEMAVRLTN